MKISHEVPLQLLEVSRFFNDYDYALVHLLEESEKYRLFFEKSKALGREIILDNSLYELKESFDPEKFLYWVQKINPTVYIIPDDYDPEINLRKFDDWLILEKKSNCLNKKMAVIHGDSYSDLVFSYQKMDKELRAYDMIAFSTGSKIMKEEGRSAIIRKMYRTGVINQKREHHLLGAILPQEFETYRNISWIVSVDTSSPIMATFENMKFHHGLNSKPQTTVNEIFFENRFVNWELLYYNIRAFRLICNRR